MKFIIRRGNYSDYKDQLKPMIEEHWKEVGMPGADELQLNLDDEAFKKLEEINQHLGYGLFLDTTLVGYVSILIYDNFQHKGTRFAITDGFFVEKKYRGIASFKGLLEIFKQAELVLKQEFDVQYFCLNTNAMNDLKFFADCMQFTQSAVIYTKRI